MLNDLTDALVIALVLVQRHVVDEEKAFIEEISVVTSGMVHDLPELKAAGIGVLHGLPSMGDPYELEVLGQFWPVESVRLVLSLLPPWPHTPFRKKLFEVCTSHQFDVRRVEVADEVLLGAQLVGGRHRLGRLLSE